LASVEFTSNGKTYKVLKEQSFTEILDIIIIAWRDGACQRSQQFFLTRLISSSNREDVFFGYYAIKVLSWQVYVQSRLFRSTAAAPLWKKIVCVIFSCFLALFAPRLSSPDSTTISKTGKHIGGRDDPSRSKVIPT
jgi:hypothetical protein